MTDPQKFKTIIIMCTNPKNQTAPPPTGNQREEVSYKDVMLADRELQIATLRSNAEFNSSVAGQMQRQFEAMQRIAKPWSESTMVPNAYRNNIGNCIIALETAYRMKLPPLTVMQNLNVINGNPSWAAAFLIASVNACGKFTTLRYRKTPKGKVGKIRYAAYEWSSEKGEKKKRKVIRDFDGSDIDNWEFTAVAVEKSTGETLEGAPVSIDIAVKEGWYTREGSKWANMPFLMLSYRAAAFWQRQYAPELSMGLRSTEEEEDVIDVEYEDLNLNDERNDSTDKTADMSRKVSSVEDAKEKLRTRASSGGRRKVSTVNNDMP